MNSAAFVREAIQYAKIWPGTASLATHRLALLSESVSFEDQQAGIVTVDKKALPSFPTLLTRQVSGDLLVQLSYDRIETLFGCAMGFENPNLPEEVDTGVYRHLFEIDNRLDSQGWLSGEGWVAGSGLIAGQQKIRRGTYLVQKDTDLWEVPSCMLGGFVVQANGASVTFSTGLVGYSLTFNSLVGNSLTDLPCPLQQISFRDVSLYLSDTLPLNNQIEDILGVNITLQNNLVAMPTVETGYYIGEPRRGGPAVVSGGFALPFYSTTQTQLKDWVRNRTPLYGLIEMVGETIDGTYNYEINFWLPQVLLYSMDASVSGPEQTQRVFQFVSTESSSPLGFPEGIKSGPLLVEIYNTNPNNVFL